MILIHIDITLQSERVIKLPIHYNYIIQSAIYNSISDELAEFLHNTGYCIGKRSFKLFNFSRLNGAYKLDREDKLINFHSPLKLTISSPIDYFCESLVNTLLTKGFMCFLDYKLEIENIILRKVVVEQEKINIKTLSPVVTYSTYLKQDGGKYTCYFHPREPEFKRLVLDNLLKKYEILNKQDIVIDNFNIYPISKIKMNIVQYKGIIIKGYSGYFSVSGDNKLLQVMVDCGIGSKNSQGFGCIDIVNKDNKL